MYEDQLVVRVTLSSKKAKKATYTVGDSKAQALTKGKDPRLLQGGALTLGWVDDHLVLLDGAGDATLVVEGPGVAHATRSGHGAGDAVRSGAGAGHVTRSGPGTGNAYRYGTGSGDAWRTHDGPGRAHHAGAGPGAAYDQYTPSEAALFYPTVYVVVDEEGVARYGPEEDFIEGIMDVDDTAFADGKGTLLLPDQAAHPLPGQALTLTQEGERIVLSGEASANLHVLGEGTAHAVRKGVGPGSVLRSGDGDGDALRDGEGDGDAERAGWGDGAARCLGYGDGDACRTGTGNGDVERSGPGNGVAEDWRTLSHAQGLSEERRARLAADIERVQRGQ